MPGKCTAFNVCYHCKVEREDNHTCETYTGLTCRPIKTRIREHLSHAENYDPVNNKAGMSKLSQHVGGLIFDNIPWNWEWQILCHSQTFSPISNRCDLCLKEKYYIMYHPELATLNLRSELFGACRHKERHLLIKQPTWENFPFKYFLLVLIIVVQFAVLHQVSPDDCCQRHETRCCNLVKELWNKTNTILIQMFYLVPQWMPEIRINFSQNLKEIFLRQKVDLTFKASLPQQHQHFDLQ